ncbi:hypothetical protein [Limnobacter sp.]|uniref:hypothetical protein n=1 Tax=Limnobacter sp. TaxID=2003368 RepID=UPI003516F3A9
MTDEFQQQRLQGRALTGQFMGFDPNGLAKLKVGNVVVRLLLEVGTKPPAIGASMVVNITGRQPTLKYESSSPANHPHLEVFDEVLSRRIAQGDIESAEDAPHWPLSKHFLHDREVDVLSQVSKDGVLLGKVSQTFNPREGVKLELMATQLGLLSRVGTGGANQAALDVDPRKLHPLLDALGMQAPDVQSFQSKIQTLADLLRQAIERSGLFYESHIKRWRAGQYPMELLQEEPQSDWEPAAVLRAQFDGLVPEQTKSALMANLQLNLLHNHKFAVVFPGLYGEMVHLDIELGRSKRESSEQQSEGRPHHDEIIQGIHFNLKVTLPNLGRVHAHYRMWAESGLLELTVEAHAVTWVKEELSKLTGVLRAARISVKTFCGENP